MENRSLFVQVARFSFMAFTTISMLMSAPLVFAATVPANYEVRTIVTGFDIPTAMAFAPDGRIFVTEKNGAVRVVKNGVLLPTPLLKLSAVNTNTDRGLLGIAVDPDFATNGFLYLSYTYDNTPGQNDSGQKTGRIVRVTVVGDSADESSMVILVGSVSGNANTPSCTNYPTSSDCIASDAVSHSMGGLHFGPDGKLYASIGDGANFEYVDWKAYRAQDIDSLNGKLLRINKDGTGPSDNPFYNGDPNSNRSKVYAYGVRNMYRFNFRPGTTTIYGGDVGYNTWEEVNTITRGANLGWPCREGSFPSGGYSCTALNYTDPLYAYNHNNVSSAVTGGAFPGAAFPTSTANEFFFGDYTQDWIKFATVNPSNGLVSVTDFITGAGGPVDIERAPDGSLYYIAIYTGDIKRISYTLGNRQPTAVPSATPNSGVLPLSVSFSGLGSSDPDNDILSYVWNYGDGSSGTGATTTHTFTLSGAYDVVLTVTDGKGGVDTKSVRVTAGNQKPIAEIISPSTGSLYRIGQPVYLVASGTDPETGALSSSSFAWHVLLHHDGHVHYLTDLVGSNVSFPGPDHENPVAIWVEVQLTVTDNAGLTDTKSVNLYLDTTSIPPPSTTNLVVNPSMEISTVNPLLPDGWATNTYLGTTANFTYPVAGTDGAKAGRIDITAHTDGDAKWIFTRVPVTPGTTYTFSDQYLSTVPSYILLDIELSDGTYLYPMIGNGLAPAAGWTIFTASYQMPANAKSATVFHLIDQVGSLTIDNTQLSAQGSTPPPPPPPPPPPLNLIANPSAENPAANPALPLSWSQKKTGTSNAKFTYLTTGLAGVRSLKIDITSRRSGEAEWVFDEVPVTGGASYSYSNSYSSSVVTDVVARYHLANGKFTNVTLGTLPVAISPGQAKFTITAPASAVAVTIYQRLTKVGTLTTDDYTLTLN